MKRDAAPLVSVIIVTWNVRELTLECLRTLFERSAAVPLEVLVVDNGSSDGTPEAIRARFPSVIVIESPENLGFPKANNLALRQARGKYILFLNSDTEIGEGTLARCVEELERDATIGMVGCRLMYPDGRVQYEAGRNPYLLRHLLAEVFYLHMFFPNNRVLAHHVMGDWDHMDNRDVEAISGAYMLVRREIAEEIGGLPEDLMMAHEDLAFCLRVRRLGHRIRYLGDVATLHLTNRTTNKHNLRWYLLEGEIKIRLIREAQGPLHAAAGRLVFAVRSLVRVAIALVGAILPGLRSAKARYPKVFHLERHVLHFAWALSPRMVRPLIPTPGQNPR